MPRISRPCMYYDSFQLVCKVPWWMIMFFGLEFWLGQLIKFVLRVILHVQLEWEFAVVVKFYTLLDLVVELETTQADYQVWGKFL